ncbi:hypothetical protein MC885_008068 [Smutsia gigantea]|nr:hypothetical protein MC885_008068 [Smutsia gigantea]
MEGLEEDVKFIMDETLDFGGLSPSDSREEEDMAMLTTPEKPIRRGLSHRSDPNAVAPAPQGLRLSLGPLSPEKLEEILDEANRLAAHLERCALQEREGTGEGSGPRRVKPSPRRETFVLKDSPVRDLLPTVSSLAWSTPSPSSLTPRLRGSTRKASVKALRATSGKRPSGMKRVSLGSHPLAICSLHPKAQHLLLLPDQLLQSGAKLGPVGEQQQARLPLSDPSRSHSLRPAALSTCLDPREQLLSLPVDSLFPQPSRDLPAECHSPAGVCHPAKVLHLQILCQPGKDFQGRALQGTEVRKNGYKVPVSQRPNLPVAGAARSHLQAPRKVAVPGPTR